MKRIILIFGLLALFSVRSVLNAKNINEVLGVTHTGGKYCLTKEPFIIEGAHKIDSMGFKTIKFFLSKDMASLYPYNSEWELSKDATWTEVVSSKYFDEVFKMDFKTVVFNITDHNKQLAKKNANFSKSPKEIGDLVKYLKKRFADRDITFIIKNWEGDWILRGPANKEDKWAKVPEDVKKLRCENFIKWINSRQEAIDKARESVKNSKCKVYHALEANKVMVGIDGVVSVSNSVLPFVKVDLVSWSSYDGLKSAKDMERGIKHLSEMHRNKGAFPEKQTVMIGEIGFQEQVANFDVAERMKSIYDKCLEMDVPYIIYWEIYCNEPKDQGTRSKSYPMRTTDEMKGLWLFRPDGSESIVCKVLKDYLNR